jgi:hypothetical protein
LPTQQLIVSDNRIIADQGAAVNFATGGPYKDVIVERNYSRFLGLPDGASIFEVKIETEETYGVTVRNNIEFTDSGNGFRFVYGSALGDVWAYGNTIVTSSGPSSATTLGCNGTFAGGFCSNNVLWAYVGDAEVNRSDIPGAGNFGPDDLGSISPFFKMLDVLTPPAVADFELDASSPAANGAVELEHFNRVDFLMRERLPEGASGALEMIPIGG